MQVQFFLLLLIGLLPPTEGSAFLDRVSIEEAMNQSYKISYIKISDEKFLNWNCNILTDSLVIDTTMIDTISESRRAEIFMEFLGSVGMDEELKKLGHLNALAVFEHFALKVETFKDKYDSLEWGVVNMYYFKLNTRLVEIRNELDRSDNLKIVHIKVELAPVFRAKRMGNKETGNKD